MIHFARAAMKVQLQQSTLVLLKKMIPGLATAVMTVCRLAVI